MTDPMEVVEKLCERYQTAVSNNDSDAYSKLFAEDAIRIPPGSEPEHGPSRHQKMAETIQPRPTASGTQHAAASPSNSMIKWPITGGLYNGLIPLTRKRVNFPLGHKVVDHRRDANIG